MLYEGDGLERSDAAAADQRQQIAGRRAVWRGCRAAGRSIRYRPRVKQARLESGDARPLYAEELYHAAETARRSFAGESQLRRGKDARTLAETLCSSRTRDELDVRPWEERWICADEREHVRGVSRDGQLDCLRCRPVRRSPALLHRGRAARALSALNAAEAEHITGRCCLRWTALSKPRSRDEDGADLDEPQRRQTADPADDGAGAQAGGADRSGWLVRAYVAAPACPPGTQLSGIDGLRTIIERLQGFFLPASHWESIVFPPE